MAIIKKSRKHGRLSFGHISWGYNAFMRFWGLYKGKEIFNLLRLTGKETVADLGGGTGYYSQLFARSCREVHLVDADPQMVARVGKRNNLIARVGDACHTSFPPDSFDLVLLNDVLHHVSPQRQLVNEARRILKPGGICVLYDFNAGHLITRWLAEFEHLFFGTSLCYLNIHEAVDLLKNSGFFLINQKKRHFYYILVSRKGEGDNKHDHLAEDNTFVRENSTPLVGK